MADNVGMQNTDAMSAMRLVAIRRRLAHFRWWLIAGLAALAMAAGPLLEIALPLLPLAILLGLLAIYNLITQLWAGPEEFGQTDLAGQLTVDLTALAVVLYLTGGATNPLVSLLLLPVAVAAFFLPVRNALALALLAAGLYTFLMVWSIPLPVGDAARAARLHLVGMWLTFIVSVLSLAWFIARMRQVLHERDAQLAAAREEAQRDAQVVALGQWAAGAAHELGTPLATLNVLTSELLHDPRVPATLGADLELMRQQIARCKEIVGGLTRKAGFDRAGESVPADRWIEALLSRWHVLWPQATYRLEIIGTGNVPTLPGDASLEQGVTNLLDNAARIAPADMRVAVDWDRKTLRLIVRDTGPGFPAEIIQGRGLQPLPAIATGGSGIGLWLTRAAVERRGGHLRLHNAEGGVAILELPLEGMP